MARTPHSQENALFTQKAHLAAQKKIYPYLFKVVPEALKFTDTTIKEAGEESKNSILDGEMGVDCITTIHVPHLRHPLQVTSQERFRRFDDKYKEKRDLTVTEHNRSSDLPSELYKTASGIFVYGYYDEKENRFGEVVIADTAKLLLFLARNEIRGNKGYNPRSNQDFLGFPFGSLARCGVILAHFRTEGLSILPESKYTRPIMFKWKESND